MRRKSILFLLAVLLLIGASVPVTAVEQSFDDTRSIYVGDVITVEIMTRDFSSEALRERFKDFDIVEIKDVSGGYALSLRTFETGEHTVLLGDKEVVIDVRSTLDEIKRDGIFEGGAGVIEPGFLV